MIMNTVIMIINMMTIVLIITLLLLLFLLSKLHIKEADSTDEHLYS